MRDLLVEVIQEIQNITCMSNTEDPFIKERLQATFDRLEILKNKLLKETAWS